MKSLASLLLTCLCSVTASAALPSEKEITAYAQHALRIWQVPGLAIAVVENDRPRYVGGIGARELGKPQRMNADTVFTIASVTKAFAAMAAAAAVDAGQIEWDQPVIHTLPELRLSDAYITAEATFRDLFAHRVGIAGEYVNGLALSRSEMVGLIKYARPVASFRAKRVYSNLLYGAAGLALANAVGMSWDDHIRTTLFQPLGMTSSSTTARELAEADNHAASHLRGRDGVLRVDPFRPNGWWSMDNHAPAGAINSTARDMARWLEFQLGDGTFRGRSVVGAAAFAETHRDQALHSDPRPSSYEIFFGFASHNYTLGWQSSLYGGERVLWHGGLFRGHNCVALIHPASQFGVFVFANARDRGLSSAVAQWILDRHLDRPERDWVKEEKKRYDEQQAVELQQERILLQRPSNPRSASAQASAYVGSYVARDGWERYQISLQSGQLRLDLQQMAEPYFAILEHWNGAAYRPSWNETVVEYEPAGLVTFTFDPQGEVRSMLFFQSWTDEVTEFLRSDGGETGERSALSGKAH